MDTFIELFVEHFIEIFLILVFLVCSFLMKLYKNRKCLMVYAILFISIILIIYDALLKTDTSITSITPIIYLISFNVYLCSLLVFPINKKNHLILFLIYLLGVVASIALRNIIPSMALMGIVDIIYFIIIIAYTFMMSKNKYHLEAIILVIGSLVNILCIFLQYIYPSKLLLNEMILVSTIIVFISYVVKEYNEKKVDEEKKIQTQRTSIAISQIQPHFLYNSLATIGYICKKDAKKASEAIDKFSDYLRANLNSLRTEKNIPFKEEMNHVDTYLWLEKLRFQDRLEVIYDIGVEDFLVPPLSIQPLVENAVKHGICEKIEGGTLLIRTIEYSETIKIIIRDTGVGFNPKVKKNDGKSHVGIENVTSRIKSMANGDVTFTSEIGKGTTFIITLPKEIK